MSQRGAPRASVTVTADDFGLAIPVDEAVEIAHRKGVLSAASLMVAGEAAHDAVSRAKRLPTLRVGLHIVVVDGRPMLPPEQVPDLVDATGHFDDRLVRAGVRFFFLPRVRRQLHAEVRAQWDAFRVTGLTLDHVNGHRHMHLHPTVLSAILAAAGDAPIPSVRVPSEPFRATRGLPAARRIAAMLRVIALAPWLRLMRWRLRRAGVQSDRYVLGLSDTGQMTEDALLRLVAHLPTEPTEIYCHPATRSDSPTPLPKATEQHEAELHALCSSKVRNALMTAGAVAGHL